MVSGEILLNINNPNAAVCVIVMLIFIRIYFSNDIPQPPAYTRKYAAIVQD